MDNYKPPEITQESVKQWAANTNGFWHIDTARKELNLQVGSKAWLFFPQLLNRLKERGVITPVKTKGHGWWRYVEQDIDEMVWKTADENAKLDLSFPFELERYVKMLPKSVAVIAGSSDAGKTAYLMDFAARNMGKFDVDYYNSEMSPEEFKLRWMSFIPDPNLVPDNFHVYERYENFGDVIKPDHISVIDYVDVPEGGEFWKIGQEIDGIHRKLDRGMAFVGIQKKYNTHNYKGQEVKFELGYGAEQTIKKARLYLVMDKGTLLIKKGKLWVDPTRNPNGMKWNFMLRKGSEFFNINLVEKPSFVPKTGDLFVPKEEENEEL